MAAITLTVLEDGTPVGGAQIVAGEFAKKAVTTDANGQVAATVDADFAILTSIIILVDGVNRGVSGEHLVRAGDNLVLDIGSTKPA